jgi:hypothetical protein
MGTTNHTPDPAQGAIIDARAGGAVYIIEADDTEPVRAAIVRLTTQQLADWIAYLTKGPENDIDFKITGNGTPPSGGYTPTTRPIEIKGQGLKITAPLTWGSGATKSGLEPISTGTVLGTGSTVTVTKQEYKCADPAITDITTTVADIASAPAAHTYRVRFYQKSGTNSRTFENEDATTICVFPAGGICWVEMSWNDADTIWDVSAFGGGTTVP